MKRCFIILLSASSILLVIGFSTCDDPVTPPLPEVQNGKIAFYTNAHDYLKSDSVKVLIYLDSIPIGVLSASGLGDSLDCKSESDSVLLIERPVGTYKYYAKTEDTDSIVWSGTVNVVKDSLSIVGLDVMDVVDELTKVKFKLIGIWKDYYTPTNSYVSFFRNDSVYETINGRLDSYGSYKLVTKDTLEVDRPTPNPRYYQRITRHNIVFVGNDTLSIKYFTRVTVGVIPYTHRYLVRIKND